jgi:hypothetical protein
MCLHIDPEIIWLEECLIHRSLDVRVEGSPNFHVSEFLRSKVTDPAGVMETDSGTMIRLQALWNSYCSPS